MNGGTNYAPGEEVLIKGGNGYGFKAEISATVGSGSIDQINIEHGGFGYSVEDIIIVESELGQQAELRPIFEVDHPFSLEAIVHDANGSILSKPVDWNISFDFNASEGNNSRVAELNATTGNYVGLNLYSTLRRHHGSVKEIEILSGGASYAKGDTIIANSINGFGFNATVSEVNSSTGAVVDINITQNGFDFLNGDVFEVNSTNGVGAKIQPVFYDGYLTLEANSTVLGQPISSKVKVRASLRDILSSKELWLDKYLDSILEQNATWWQKDAKITVNLPAGYEDDLYYFCTNHSGSMSGQFRIQQNINRIFVSGGQTTAPFYDFKDSDGKTIDFNEFKLIAGKTYVFMASDINASHPFKISDQNGTETPLAIIS